MVENVQRVLTFHANVWVSRTSFIDFFGLCCCISSASIIYHLVLKQTFLQTLSDGYTGPKCEISPNAEEKNDYVCDLDCQNGGKCFFGQTTVVDEELKNLHDSGLDFLVDNKHCRCTENWVGLRCEKKYEACGDNEHYCLNGSDCVPDSDGFTCDCRAAGTFLNSYAGKYCEHASTEFCSGPGANNKSFCTNHGTCLGTIGTGEE